MHVSDGIIHLGGEHSAAKCWDEHTDQTHGLPTGVLWTHPNETDRREHPCAVYVAWATNPDTSTPTLVTLDSLRPLSIVDELTCPYCGCTGRIEESRWIPA